MEGKEADDKVDKISTSMEDLKTGDKDDKMLISMKSKKADSKTDEIQISLKNDKTDGNNNKKRTSVKGTGADGKSHKIHASIEDTDTDDEPDKVHASIEDTDSGNGPDKIHANVENTDADDKPDKVHTSVEDTEAGDKPDEIAASADIKTQRPRELRTRKNLPTFKIKIVDTQKAPTRGHGSTGLFAPDPDGGIYPPLPELEAKRRAQMLKQKDNGTDAHSASSGETEIVDFRTVKLPLAQPPLGEIEIEDVQAMKWELDKTKQARSRSEGSVDSDETEVMDFKLIPNAAQRLAERRRENFQATEYGLTLRQGIDIQELRKRLIAEMKEEQSQEEIHDSSDYNADDESGPRSRAPTARPSHSRGTFSDQDHDAEGQDEAEIGFYIEPKADERRSITRAELKLGVGETLKIRKKCSIDSNRYLHIYRQAWAKELSIKMHGGGDESIQPQTAVHHSYDGGAWRFDSIDGNPLDHASDAGHALEDTIARSTAMTEKMTTVFAMILQEPEVLASGISGGDWDRIIKTIGDACSVANRKLLPQLAWISKCRIAIWPRTFERLILQSCRLLWHALTLKQWLETIDLIDEHQQQLSDGGRVLPQDRDAMLELVEEITWAAEFYETCKQIRLAFSVTAALVKDDQAMEEREPSVQERHFQYRGGRTESIILAADQESVLKAKAGA